MIEKLPVKLFEKYGYSTADAFIANKLNELISDNNGPTGETGEIGEACKRNNQRHC